ncbi:MAG: histidine phosphatase family protein [Gammaproteobacteria bacterium]|nr:histidine phosphatase family protein [Gammaproteobacteria bacterium]
MAAPGITRHRRPFLAPIWITALVVLFAGAVLFVGARLALTYLNDVSTVVVLRHAEKAASPAGDPALTEEGRARAERLAQMFGDAAADLGAVRLVISSDARRARETAAPLAARLGLAVRVLPAADVDAVVQTVHREGRGLTSLVVGHADTVPRLIAALGDGPAQVTVEEGDYGSIFIVTISSFGPAKVLQLRY